MIVFEFIHSNMTNEMAPQKYLQHSLSGAVPSLSDASALATLCHSPVLPICQCFQENGQPFVQNHRLLMDGSLRSRPELESAKFTDSSSNSDSSQHCRLRPTPTPVSVSTLQTSQVLPISQLTPNSPLNGRTTRAAADRPDCCQIGKCKPLHVLVLSR